MNRHDLGPLGVSVVADDDGHRARAADAERRGASTVWLAGGQLSSLDRLTDVVDATSSVRVGSSIVMIADHDADELADTHRRAAGRLVAGIGGGQGGRMLDRFAAYFDRLDELGVPRADRMLAALGPRKLTLARDRSAGAIVLLLTPEHTAWVRAQVGPDAVVVVQQVAAVDDDVDRARDAVRDTVGFLADLPGYRANLHRMGFTDDDVATRSDRLLDGVAACGPVSVVDERVAAHLDAGADHVLVDYDVLTAGVGTGLLTPR